MNNALRLLILSFLLLLTNSCRSQNKTSYKVPEKFSVLEAKLLNGKPVVGSFNMAYKNYNLKSQYNWCLKISIALELKNVTSKGLPTTSESTIANKFEEEIISEIRKITNIQYVGHLYNDTFLDIYVYLNNPEKVNSYLKKKVDEQGIPRGFGYQINQDPHWDIVKPFLN